MEEFPGGQYGKKYVYVNHPCLRNASGDPEVHSSSSGQMTVLPSDELGIVGMIVELEKLQEEALRLSDILEQSLRDA